MAFMSYNGNGFIAMKGYKCIALGSNKWPESKTATLLEITPFIHFGVAGMPNDIKIFEIQVSNRMRPHEMNGYKHVTPQSFSVIVSDMLYYRRFGPCYVEPVIAGIDGKTFQPYLCSIDVVGGIQETNNFVVGGSGKERLQQICEAVWKPDLKPDELFRAMYEAVARAFVNNVVPGWGALVNVVEETKVTTSFVTTNSKR